MKTQTLLLLLLPFAFACQNAVKKESKTTVAEDSIAVAKIPEEVLLEPRIVTDNEKVLSQEDLYGYWVGDFKPLERKDSNDEEAFDENDFVDLPWDKINKINISIDSFKGDTVIGHSVVAGNRRPFKGTFQLKDSVYSFKVAEPGDDTYDGEFNFSIPISGAELSGTWKAYKTIETPEREYSLSKKKFVYQPEAKLTYRYMDWNKIKKNKHVYEGEVYFEESYFTTTAKIYKLNPSTTLLTKKQVENLKKGDIFILRNSIYAKHGYSFKKRPLREFFDAQEWYIPMYTNIKSYLSAIEKENIKLLLAYEEHAKEYYDTFGR